MRDVLLITLLLGWLLSRPVKAAVLYHEDFNAIPMNWSFLPEAHASYQSMSLDSLSPGGSPPMLRVRMEPATLNFQLTTPALPLPRLDDDYTIALRLRVEAPDSPFRVELILTDSLGQWLSRRMLVDLSGERGEVLRQYRFSFRGPQVPRSGYCRLLFGLPYVKAFREGTFWIDDVELRTGAETGRVEFYLEPRSVNAGDEVRLHVSSDTPNVIVQVYRESEFQMPLGEPIQVKGLEPEQIPGEAWQYGAKWPVAGSIRTGLNWSSGAYVVKVDSGLMTTWDAFVIRGSGGDGPLLVILPTHTDQAYNDWGGRSFYTNPPSAGLSFERPTPSSLYLAPIHLLRYLEREGIGYALATDGDLHDHPEMLVRYPGVALTWHSEYWSRGMREAIEDYVAAGGSVLSLSGNTCWWQTRLEDGHLVCYKYDAGNDPYWSIDPDLVTTHWDEPPVNDPPTRFLGLSWREGGMVNYETASSCPCPWDWLLGHGGYRIDRPEHWVFAGVDFDSGEDFGRPYAIVGYEVDGAPVEWIDGKPEILQEGGTPPGFAVLGHAKCWNRYHADSTGVALMCIKELPGSYIFNGGTTGWCWGLPHDRAVQTVTRNLIARLGTELGPTSAGRTRLEVFPNPARTSVQFRVTGSPRPDSIRIFCANGRCVFTGALHRTTSWPMVDESGRSLPSGVYLVRALGTTTRFVHMK